MEAAVTDVLLFVRGAFIGFLIAAPVGPVGVLCIRRALNDGRTAAFVASLGAALADTFYGAVTGFGLRMVSDFLLEHELVLHGVGGMFMVVLGVQTFRAPTPTADAPAGRGLARDFVSTFLITLTNPATILAFLGIFAAFGAIQDTARVFDAGVLVAGVFAGSALWWLTLSALAGAVRHRFTPRWLHRLNQASGAAIAGFGVVVIGGLVV